MAKVIKSDEIVTAWKPHARSIINCIKGTQLDARLCHDDSLKSTKVIGRARSTFYF